LAAGLGLRGPDYSKGPAPRKTDGELTLREGDLPELHVTCCFAKLNVTLALGKDTKLWLYLNDGVTEAKDLGPCELFGFGVGDFVECTDVPPKDTIGERLIFSLQSDVDYIVEAQTLEGKTFDKRLDTVASVPYRIGVVDGVPGVTIQGHELQPMMNADGTKVDYRHNLKQSLTTWEFKPDVVRPSGADAGADTAVKSNAFGQHLLQNEYSGFKVPACAPVLWECAFEAPPPPSINVKKPKAWLLGKTNLQPGSFYYLV